MSFTTSLDGRHSLLLQSDHYSFILTTFFNIERESWMSFRRVTAWQEIWFDADVCSLYQVWFN